MAGNLTIDALLAQGTALLRDSSSPSSTAALDAEILLAHTLSVNRAYLKAHAEAIPAVASASGYFAFLQRRADGEPVAYIVGYRDFWTLRLAVNPAVLVPRPETELLVERALDLGPGGPAELADLGTGSGAIALALASERPEWAVTATDVSEAALRVARDNAVTLQLSRVEFALGDWFQPLLGRCFDLVLSNPPYVATGDLALRDPALQREPQIALTPGGRDASGLACLRTIIDSAPHHLKRRGWLLLEHGNDQAEAVAQMLVDRGFTHVRSHRDLAGHPRMTEAQQP